MLLNRGTRSPSTLRQFSKPSPSGGVESIGLPISCGEIPWARSGRPGYWCSVKPESDCQITRRATLKGHVGLSEQWGKPPGHVPLGKKHVWTHPHVLWHDSQSISSLTWHTHTFSPEAGCTSPEACEKPPGWASKKGHNCKSLKGWCTHPKSGCYTKQPWGSCHGLILLKWATQISMIEPYPIHSTAVPCLLEEAPVHGHGPGATRHAAALKEPRNEGQQGCGTRDTAPSWLSQRSLGVGWPHCSGHPQVFWNVLKCCSPHPNDAKSMSLSKWKATNIQE